MTPDKLFDFWHEFTRDLDAARKWVTPPETLYHYTTLSSFAGILSAQHFWASNVRFLNDRRELDYTLALLSNVFNAVRDVGRAPECWQILKTLQERIVRRASSYDVYVVCFTEAEDAKTIWMSYQASDGVAVGIDSEAIALAWRNRGPILQRVVYTRDDQEAYLTNLLVRALDVVERFGADLFPDHEALGVVTFSLEQKLLEAAVRFKSDDFADEREWRAVYVAAPFRADHPASSRYFNELPFANLRFRAAPGRLVPYFAVTLLPETEQMIPIREIVCGPKLEASSMERALNLARRRFQYENFRVRHSKLQLR